MSDQKGLIGVLFVLLVVMSVLAAFFIGFWVGDRVV